MWTDVLDRVRRTRTWVLLDVDGTLSALRATPGAAVGYTPNGTLNIPAEVPTCVQQIAALPHTRLALCTSWLDDANKYVVPQLGLGKRALPVVPYQTTGKSPEAAKVAAVRGWAALHPSTSVVLLDDSVSLNEGRIRTVPVVGHLGPEHVAAVTALAG